VIARQFWNARSGETSYCGACKCAAATKPTADYGRAPKLTTASRCFGFEAKPNRAVAETLSYSGLSNLQVIDRDVHVVKCATEARYRRNGLAEPELS
jgi:hypothetical protein